MMLWVGVGEKHIVPALVVCGFDSQPTGSIKTLI